MLKMWFCSFVVAAFMFTSVASYAANCCCDEASAHEASHDHSNMGDSKGEGKTPCPAHASCGCHKAPVTAGLAVKYSPGYVTNRAMPEWAFYANTHAPAPPMRPPMV